MENPTPADIFDFLAAHPTIQEGKVTRNLLAEAMAVSENEDASSEWGATFAGLDPKTMSNVQVTMLAMLGAFRDPNVRDALRMPTEKEMARGCRIINFHDLRKKGTAIYVVVPEGEASRLQNVVATMFAMALDVLRETGDAPDACYTLVELDEAGNVPLRNLSEGVGVGRGRKIIFALGYQNISQPEKQYGRATAFSILQSIGAKFFLPGLTGDTAEWAVKMIGRTTALQRQSVDAVGDAFDNEKLSEVGTELMPLNELRQMLRYTQGVAVINNAPPARIAFPPNAKEIDTRISNPRPFADKDDLDSTIPAAFARPSSVVLPPDAIVHALPDADDGDVEADATANLVTDANAHADDATNALLNASTGDEGGNGAAGGEQGAQAHANGNHAADAGATDDDDAARPAIDEPLIDTTLSPASLTLVEALGNAAIPTVTSPNTQRVIERAVADAQPLPASPFASGAGFNFNEFRDAQARLDGTATDDLHIEGDRSERSNFLDIEELGDDNILEI
jgi:hypothetical protein